MKSALCKILICVPMLCSVCLAEPALISLSDCTDSAINNITLAMEAVNGTELECGDTFSFNKIVGPRTESRGYESAQNGRGITVTGGGVARVASVIYLALKESDINITYRDRYTYGSRYKGSYVKDSSDAILVDYASGIDFSFISNEDSLYLTLYIEDGNLYCDPVTDDDSEADFSADMPMITFADFSIDCGITVASSVIDLSDSSANQIKNIKLAAETLDGTVLSPGSVFSFNKIVGPRKERYGYVSAENGRGKKVTGGGVAQTASALWLAVKELDSITVISRSTYGSHYSGRYVKSSNDAILTDYDRDIDFSFRNDGDDDLTINMSVSDDMLYCELTM